MTADPFTPTESPTQPSPGQPGPAEAGTEPTGPVLDWQPLPERHYPDGRKRWQGCWPTNYHTSGRKWHKKDGSTALERAEAKKAAQAAEDNRRLTSRQIAAKMDDKEKGNDIA